jgi:hypothetical protein
MKVNIVKNWGRGMGTQLCALSTFLHAGIRLIETGDMNTFQTFVDFKKIFNLSDIDITYSSEYTVGSLFPDDCFKLFSPYYKKPKMKGKKPYIGMACYDSVENIFNYSNQDYKFPRNKFQPIENYAEIFKLIKHSGYDVLTIDSKTISRKDKAWVIENLCECVIGYEGGIAHLCHMLDTPFIMIPWQYNGGLEQLQHLDNKTYFLNSVHELLNWIGDNQILNKVIDDLNNEKGNNKFLSKEKLCNVDENFGLTDELGNLIPVYFNDDEKKFFRKYLKNYQLAGI